MKLFLKKRITEAKKEKILTAITYFSSSTKLSTTHLFFRFVFALPFSPHCSQRDGGLAQRRLPLPLLRGTNFQFRTTFVAGFLPPLRQTAR
jgi:hypothetical protein